MSKETFTVKVGDADVEFAVAAPTADQMHKAQLHYNKTFAEALQNGAILKAALTNYMRKQNLWDDAKQTEYDDSLKVINDGEKKLAKGNIKKSEAKKIALDMRLARAKLQRLLSSTVDLHSNTAEGQAENDKFSFLVSLCTVYNKDGKQYFKDLPDYLQKWQDGDLVAISATNKFANIYYGLASDNEKKLPENKFLAEYGFVDDKLRLVDKDGHLVDIDGKLIDEFGRYIDEKGDLIDSEGTPIDEMGNYKATEPPVFLDG